MKAKLKEDSGEEGPPLGYIKQQIMADVKIKSCYGLKRMAGNREEWQVAANQLQG